MNDKPTPEEVATWQRRLASQANNRAWALSESSARSPEEDEEMLQAAHAAMYFWKIVGTPNNRAHAAQLLAHVYALLKLPNPANHYLAQSQPFFMQGDCAPWEWRSLTLLQPTLPLPPASTKSTALTSRRRSNSSPLCQTQRIARS